MIDSISIITAFGAGVASFLAPCTLALVPAFLVYLTGFTLSDQGQASHARLRIESTLNSITFVLGFTSIFVILGSSLGALSEAVGTNSPWLNRVGGILVIGFGLAALGLIKAPILERGFTIRTDFLRNLRYFGSFLVGATFAVGWVPCVGPILGGILVLAGTSGSAEQGAVLLFAYSLGIMLPFLGAGLFTGWTSALLRHHGRWLQYANFVGGVLLIALGIAVFTNLLPELASYRPLTT